MTLIPFNSTLRSVLDVPICDYPEDFLKLLGINTTQKKGVQPVYEWIREVQTRLYLYDVVLLQDENDYSTDVRNEVKRNELLCLALLLYANWKLRSEESAWLVLQELVDRGIEDADDKIRHFLADQTVNLFLDVEQRDTLISIEELRGTICFSSEQDAVLKLASIVASYYDEQSHQVTIHALLKLTENKNTAGIAANFLLARIYENLQLPFEEQKCLTSWIAGLEQIHSVSIAQYAASLASRNSQLESTVITASIRLIDLLKASDSRDRINGLIDDFEKFGYTTHFSQLRSFEGRSPNVDLHVISREDFSDINKFRRLLTEVLLRSPSKKACFVLRDESVQEVETFPLPRSKDTENNIVSLLTERVSDASVTVHDDIVNEGILEQRKWILCYDAANPIDALGIGLMAMEREISIIYSRVLFFDTQLDTQKNDEWSKNAFRVLGRAFDTQKQNVIKEAVRRILQQASVGYSSIQIEEL